jgi:hypothetical protein
MLCALLGTSALVAAVPALAADNAVAPSGLMKFANVRVENGTPQQIAAEAAATRAAQSGMRAFIDSTTGELREPTAEEAADSGSRAKAATARGIATMMTSARGSMVIQLDDSFMMNSIVKRDASGKLQAYCVDGHDHVVDILRAPAKEARHDR